MQGDCIACDALFLKGFNLRILIWMQGASSEEDDEIFFDLYTLFSLFAIPGPNVIVHFCIHTKHKSY